MIPWLAAAGRRRLLLDTLAVQPVAAYSIARKVRTGHPGAALRNRRSSDNGELDIGFAANLLDSASLLTHCGAGAGFARFVYDQKAGTAFNLGQATAGSQPQIVNAGALITAGGRPALAGVGNSSALTAADVLGGTTAEMMVCLVTVPQAGRVGLAQFSTGGSNCYMPFTDQAYYFDVGGASAPNRISSGAVGVNGATDIITLINSAAGSIQQIWRNGVLIASDATAHSVASTALAIMNAPDYWQEMLVFNTALAIAQRDTITRNQGAFYGVTIP
jgi:hypothetical protein